LSAADVRAVIEISVDGNRQERHMRFMDPPSLDSPARGRSGDDLDGLLRAFFRAEMPNPWPGAPVVEEAPVVLSRPASARSARTLFRSRMALAASVAFLLGIPWLISDSFKSVMPDDAALVAPTDGTADRSIKLETELQVQPNGETGIRINAHEGPATTIKNQVKDMLP